MIAKLEDAEGAVRQVFHQEFPGKVFSHWNTEIDDRAAQNIISAVDRASTINVKKFIQDLWDAEDEVPIGNGLDQLLAEPFSKFILLRTAQVSFSAPCQRGMH